MRPFVAAGWFAIVCASARAAPTPLAMATAIAKEPPPVAIDYRVRRLPSADRYEITLRFSGEHSGRSMLTVPSTWASATQAERGIEGLAVTTPGARLEDTDAPQTKRIVHRPDAMLAVRYVLKQIAAGEPAANARTQFLPVIQRNYFEWIGWTAWVIPVSDNRRPVRVRLAFRDLPSDWAFASSYGLDPTTVAFEGPMDRFQSALFIAGDFRLRSRHALGGPIVTAMRGDWSFGDDAFADRVARIVDGERAFWKDDTQKYYLIALLPLAAQPGWRSSTGTGLSQSFVTFVTTDTPLDDLDALWAHEYFHTWNSRQLGRFPEPQPRLYWFSEGFTDYYMNLMQLRLGLMSLDQYAKAYDRAMRFLAESPEGHAPNDEVIKRFFSDPVVGRLPYARGMLLAARWDAEIHAASGDKRSLDDAMRTLREQNLGGVEVLDAGRIVEVMQSYGVRNAAADIDRQIELGELPPWPDGVLGDCIRIGVVTAPRYDLGFDRQRSEQSPTIVGVDPEGPAYAAGIRETQSLRTLKSFSRADREVEVGVEEPGSTEIRTYHYDPAGKPVTWQSATVRADLADVDRARCIARSSPSPG